MQTGGTPHETGLLFKTTVGTPVDNIKTSLNVTTEPVIIFSAAKWNSPEDMEDDFKRAFPNQETEFLSSKFEQDGQVIIVKDIKQNSFDAITFLVIMLSSIMMSKPRDGSDAQAIKVNAIVLEGWPFTFVGMATEDNQEIKFNIEPLN